MGSIRLPAGIVSWDPQHGRAEPVILLSSEGGVQIDLRGPDVPRPSANRLWIDRREAEDFLCSFYRGLVRHAADLVSAGSPREEWREWLSGFFPLGVDERIWSYEAPYIADRAGYLCCNSDGSLEIMAKSAVPKPWRVWRAGEPRPGVVLPDALNSWLLRVWKFPEPKPGSPIDWSQAP